jgi:hypothetical protein
VIRFFFGLILGAALSIGGGWLWIERAHDCVRRCGDGTVCFSGRCIARGPATTVVPAPSPEKRSKARTRGRSF